MTTGLEEAVYRKSRSKCEEISKVDTNILQTMAYEADFAYKPLSIVEIMNKSGTEFALCCAVSSPIRRQRTTPSSVPAMGCRLATKT